MVSEPIALLDHQRRAAEAKGPPWTAEGLRLAALGWSHKVRCGLLRIWQDPKTGFWKGEDVAYEMANRRGANG